MEARLRIAAGRRRTSISSFVNDGILSANALVWFISTKALDKLDRSALRVRQEDTTRVEEL
jgi:hypothetical protein